MSESEPRTLLSVDDDAIVRESIGAYLEDSGFRVLQAGSGREGLELFRREHPEAVLLDLRMPDMDGLEVLHLLHQEYPETPVIIVSGAGLMSDAIEALRRGAWDFVTKPIQDLAILEHVVDRALERADLLRENRRHHERMEELVELRTGQLQRELAERKRVQEALKRSYEALHRITDGTIHSLSLMGEMRDPYTAGHQRRVALLGAAIARELGLPEERIEAVFIAGLLHDIGKISVPIEILTKPGRISELEYALIQRHPQVGYDILKGIEFTLPIAEYVWQHHERLDGQGYPQGLKGGEIHREALILSVADVVEAMSSHRPYRPGLGIDEALAEVNRHRGTRYDPEAVDACAGLFVDQGFQFEESFGG